MTHPMLVLACAATALLLAAGCASTPDIAARDPVAAQSRTAAFDAAYLQYLNIGDAAGLKTELRNWLANDVRTLGTDLQLRTDITDTERTRAMRVIRLIAVQNEKFPVPEWAKDKELMGIFQSALAADAQHASELRSKNWSTAWWAQ